MTSSSSSEKIDVSSKYAKKQPHCKFGLSKTRNKYDDKRNLYLL